MADGDFILTGMPKVNRVIESWAGPGLRKAVRAGQRAALRPVRKTAKRLVGVETGTLRKSLKIRAAKRKRGRIMHRVTSSSNEVKNSKGIYYGGFHHWGFTTKYGEKIEGSEFQKRAADRHKKSVEPIMVRTMRPMMESQV